MSFPCRCFHTYVILLFSGFLVVSLTVLSAKLFQCAFHCFSGKDPVQLCCLKYLMCLPQHSHTNVASVDHGALTIDLGNGLYSPTIHLGSKR